LLGEIKITPVLHSLSLENTISIMNDMELESLLNPAFIIFIKNKFGKYKTRKEKIFQVWKYASDNFIYKEDHFDEDLTAPKYLITTLVGDCDDYSLFIKTALKVLGIDSNYMLAGKAGQDYEHILNFVDGFFVDGTNDKFNYLDEIYSERKIIDNSNRKVISNNTSLKENLLELILNPMERMYLNNFYTFKPEDQENINLSKYSDKWKNIPDALSVQWLYTFGKYEIPGLKFGEKNFLYDDELRSINGVLQSQGKQVIFQDSYSVFIKKLFDNLPAFIQNDKYVNHAKNILLNYPIRWNHARAFYFKCFKDYYLLEIIQQKYLPGINNFKGAYNEETKKIAFELWKNAWNNIVNTMNEDFKKEVEPSWFEKAVSFASIPVGYVTGQAWLPAAVGIGMDKLSGDIPDMKNSKFLILGNFWDGLEPQKDTLGNIIQPANENNNLINMAGVGLNNIFLISALGLGAYMLLGRK